MSRAAAFLDRDGTIIVETEYLSDPGGVVLIPGAAEALARLAAMGYALVIVTNQSGIARGLYSEDDFRSVQARLDDILAGRGIAFDAVLHCPHHPDLTGPCECRKPGLGLYRRAAEDLGLDLAASLYVGDRLSDVLPALETGGDAYLVRTGYGTDEARRVPPGISVIDRLADLPPLLGGR